jgi:hypothetical protein
LSVAVNLLEELPSMASAIVDLQDEVKALREERERPFEMSDVGHVLQGMIQ